MGNDIDKYIHQLKKFNIRMTNQRYAILEYLLLKGNHPTANEIYEYLKNDFPNMSVATIYNNINFFKKAGIITELPFADGSSRFDLTKTHHYHVICANCGKVEDFDYPNFEEAERIAEKQTRFKVINHSFKVTGICLECQELLNQ